MFCGLGTDPQAWRASRINAGELRDQAAGPALAGPLTFLLRSLRSPPFAFISHPPPPPAPPLPSRAASLPGLSGSQTPRPHGLRCRPTPPLCFSRMSQGPGYLVAPTPAGAPPPRHDKHSSASIYHHDAPLRLPQRVPTKGPKRFKPSGFTREKTSDPNSWNPSLGPNFQAQIVPDPSSLSAQKAAPSFPQRHMATPFPAGPPPAQAPLEKYHKSPLKSLVLLRTP